MSRTLKAGTQVVIKAQGLTIKGTVLKADQETEGWYIEGTSDQTNGYFYWKQPSDGGKLISVDFVLESTVIQVEDWNSGGNCMITTMHIENCENLVRIDMNEESVSGFNCTLDEYNDKCNNEEGYDPLDNQLWTATTWHELREELNQDLFLEVIKHMQLFIKHHCNEAYESEFLKGYYR